MTCATPAYQGERHTAIVLLHPFVMIEGMKNEVAEPHPTDAAEQLTLLSAPEVATRFRLPEETRRRVLRHVAEIRQMLNEHGATDQTNVHRLPPRTEKAA